MINAMINLMSKRFVLLYFLLLFISSSDILLVLANDDEYHCQEIVRNGGCNLNPTETLSKCKRECFNDDQFASFGYFQSMNSLGNNDIEGYEGQDNEKERDMERKANLRCVDLYDERKDDGDDNSCAELVEDGRCADEPGFMLFQCTKSCLVCKEPGTVTFPIGVAQKIEPDDMDDDDVIDRTIHVIKKTFDYMNEIMTVPKFASIRSLCQNNNEFCSSLAGNGACEKPSNYDDVEDEEDDEDVLLFNYMMDECAPACQSCEDFITEDEASVIEDCVFNPRENIFGPGDLNRMFERIVGDSSELDGIVSKENVKILSRPSHPQDMNGNVVDGTNPNYVLGPWVVTIENFLNDEECNRLIELGKKIGYERSTLEEEKDYDEDERERERVGEDAYRTSKNAWCGEECKDDEVFQGVMNKLTNATGIPESYSEDLQLLYYVEGQYYKDHHDVGGDEFYHRAGSRIITFFLYLNDVEEGGATRFTDLTGGGISLDVQPKKGMALIWPSVLDDDPSKMDVRTYHEALPVIKGEKYGANAWFYLRSFKNDDCDYEALTAINEEYVDTEEEEEEEEEDIILHSSDEL